MLLGILMYCCKRKITNLSDVVRECKTNRVLRVFTCGKEPTISTFKRFLEDSSQEIMNKIFLYTLVVLNDYQFLKFSKAFIDGTDALIRGSRYYTINKEAIKSMKWMKKHGLLHNNRKKSIERTKKELNKMREETRDDKEFQEFLDYIFHNLKIYNKNIYRKIPEFEKIMEEKDVDYVSITFPSAVMMKTKKGRYDFAFNLQEIITDNDIILTGLLTDKPNDKNILPDIMETLKENFTILIELQEKYGERRNYKELQHMLDNAKFICDSGYFTDDNLEYMDRNGYKYLIMPKRLSQEINNELRKKNKIPEKKNKKYKRMEHVHRIKDGFICEKGHKIELKEVKLIKKRKNIREGIPESWKEHNYIYTCNACSKCPNNHLCNFEELKIKTTPLKHEMTNLFTNPEVQDEYQDRFHSSEFINGIHKGNDGTLLLPGHNKTAVQNYTSIINTVFNIFHHKNLKGTIY